NEIADPSRDVSSGSSSLGRCEDGTTIQIILCGIRFFEGDQQCVRQPDGVGIQVVEFQSSFQADPDSRGNVDTPGVDSLLLAFLIPATARSHIRTMKSSAW